MNLIWVIVLVLLVVALFGAPGVGLVSHNYGYYPSGIGLILVVVLVVLLLSGRL